MFRLLQRSQRCSAVFRRCIQLRAPEVVFKNVQLNAINTQSRFYASTVETVGPTKPPQQLTKKLVEEKVLKAIRAWDRFPQDRADKLTFDARFVEDLGLDSLDLVEITMSLEDEFGFEIPESDVDKLKTPRDIHKYVCEHEDVYE